MPGTRAEEAPLHRAADPVNGDAGPSGGRRETASRLALAAAVAASLLLSGLKWRADPDRTNGIYYQGTTSERLMQTVSALDLAREPVLSLWYLHIQPPLFDAIRMLAAIGFDGHPKQQYDELNLHVDRWLYRAWALVYALIVGLSAYWLGRLTSPWFGAGAALAVSAAHPASVFYATFLDSTLLGAAATLWISFEVWAAREDQGSIPRLIAATLFACLARSHFQWPIVLVIATALWLRKVPRRRVATYLIVAGALVMTLHLKQYRLFGLTTTSSFAGESGCRSIRAPCEPRAGSSSVPDSLDPSAARVLNRVKKREGWKNFNHVQGLRESFSMLTQYREHLSSQPIEKTVGAYRENLTIFLEPSSSYARHTIMKRLPWRVAYDRVFSGWALVGLTVVVVVVWLWPRGTRLERMGLALPVIYVASISILFESRENMRYKFFVEPALVVAIAATVHRLWLTGRARIASRR